MNTQEFHLGDVLSITTGYLVANDGMEAVYRILDFMTGECILTHQLPRAGDQCKPWLLRQHPQLADITGDDLGALLETCGQKEKNVLIERWLANQVKTLGETLTVARIPAGENGPADPIQEMIDLVGKKKTIVIEIEKKES